MIYAAFLSKNKSNVLQLVACDSQNAWWEVCKPSANITLTFRLNNKNNFLTIFAAVLHQEQIKPTCPLCEGTVCVPPGVAFFTFINSKSTKSILILKQNTINMFPLLFLPYRQHSDYSIKNKILCTFKCQHGQTWKEIFACGEISPSVFLLHCIQVQLSSNQPSSIAGGFFIIIII